MKMVTLIILYILVVVVVVKNMVNITKKLSH